MLWNRNYSVRFRFRLRFWLRLLTSYWPGYGSGFLSAQFSKKYLEKILPFYSLRLFTRKNWKVSSNLFQNVNEKNFLLAKSKCTQFYTVFVRTFVIPFCYSSVTVIIRVLLLTFLLVTVPVPVALGKRWRFLRFRFHNTDCKWPLLNKKIILKLFQ